MSDSNKLPDSRLSELLSVLGMGAYVQSFVDRGIRLEQLSTLSDRDLLELGIASAHDRAKLLDAGSVLGARSETTRSANVVAASSKTSDSQEPAHPIILPSQRSEPGSPMRRLALPSLIVGIAAATAIIATLQANTNTEHAVADQAHYEKHAPEMPANPTSTPPAAPEPSPPILQIEPAPITPQPRRPLAPDSPTAKPAEASEVSNSLPRGAAPAISSAFNANTVSSGKATDSPTHDRALVDFTNRASATASSTLPPDLNMTFSPDNLLDGSLHTSWQPSAKRTRGEGEFLQFHFDGKFEVARIDIANGFQSTYLGQDLFPMNARVKEMAITFPDRSIEVSFGENQRGFVSIQLTPPVEADAIKFHFKRVHRGTRWPDLAISEVRFFGHSLEGGQR